MYEGVGLNERTRGAKIITFIKCCIQFGGNEPPESRHSLIGFRICAQITDKNIINRLPLKYTFH